MAAFYPNSRDRADGFEALALVEDANGATLGAVVKKFAEFLKTRHEQDEFHKSMKESVQDPNVKSDLLVDSKTITFAIVGETVVATLLVST